MFKKATRYKARLRLALIGPPGSGKTYSALKLATYLLEQGSGKRGIAVIDTERGSAAKYAPKEGEAADPERGTFDFDTATLEEFSPVTYVKTIQEAAAMGFEVVIIDSLTHAWSGKGGALEMHDNAVERQRGSKNTFVAWREVTPHHNALVDAMLQSPCHVIATIRSKVEYVQEEVNGKKTIRKVGLAPVQRDGLEYEFDVIGDLDGDNTLVISKSRCPAIHGQVINKPGKDFALVLRDWLGSATEAPPPPQPAKPAAPPPVETLGIIRVQELEQLASGYEGDWNALAFWFMDRHKVKAMVDVPASEYARIRKAIMNKPRLQAPVDHGVQHGDAYEGTPQEEVAV